MLILQTTPAHDHPARPAVRQEKAMLALERSMGSAGLVISLLHARAFIGMDAGKNDIAGNGKVGREPVNGSPFFTHPCLVLIRIKTPEREIGRLRCETDSSIALTQDLLLALTFNRNPGKVSCYGSESGFFRQW